MYHKHIEHENSEGEQVGLCTWRFIAAYNLRSHKSQCTQDTTFDIDIVYCDIVNITNKNITILWIEKNIAKIDIPVAVALRVELQKAV